MNFVNTPANRITAMALVLLALGALYWSWGTYQVVFGTSRVAAIDLKFRWKDHRYVLNGQYTWDVYRASRNLPYDATRDASLDPATGAPGLPGGGSPPWSYPMGFIMIPPFPALWLTRLYFALASTLALGFVAVCAFRELRGRRRGFALLGAATVLGMTSNLFTISAGQYGVLLNAFALGSLLLAERGRWKGAGTALCFALVKPHIGAAFALVHAVRGNFRTLLTTAVLLALSTIALWLWIDTGPIEFMQNLVKTGSLSGPRWGYGLHIWVAMTGVDQAFWLLTLGLTGAVVGLALLWRYRTASLWTQLAIAAVIGRLWTYHGVYDNVMLVFLPLALLHVWSDGRGGRVVPIAWVAVMATLAAPIRYQPHIDLVWLQVIHVAVWIGGLLVLLRAESTRSYALRNS